MKKVEKKMIKKVAVLVGGMGAEREVSINTGNSFIKALKELPYEYFVVDAKEDLPRQLMDLRPDVALLALHGKYAEDGTVQGICEYLKIPYTGSGVLASALTMHKIMCKDLFVRHKIPTAEYEAHDLKRTEAQEIKTKITLPLVVKPSREGSSVGITICTEKSQILPAIKCAGEYDHLILIEKFIDGMELTVPIFRGKAIAPIEIVPKTSFYDYTRKYTKGATEYFLPPRLDEKVVNQAKEIALKVFELLELRFYSRIDFRVRDNKEPLVLEVNPLPGCTETSLVPKSAAFENISFKEFVNQLVESATLDYEGLK
ncbi:MAG: D-alanine--D-alanine ligase [Pseudomonadota bacterium]|nr:D-alanine--D-alanine ligase [Pseudomonadota bacterium]